MAKAGIAEQRRERRSNAAAAANSHLEEARAQLLHARNNAEVAEDARALAVLTLALAACDAGRVKEA